MSMTNYRREKPGAFGTAYVTTASGQIGGANYLGGAAPLTVNSTTTFVMPTPPVKARLKSLAAVTVTVPVDADGTILAKACKYNAATDAQVIIGATLDLEALVTREITVVGALSTATDAQRIFNGTSDSLEINVINNSAAIDTQPAGLIFTALWELLQ